MRPGPATLLAAGLALGSTTAGAGRLPSIGASQRQAPGFSPVQIDTLRRVLDGIRFA